MSLQHASPPRAGSTVRRIVAPAVSVLVLAVIAVLLGPRLGSAWRQIRSLPAPSWPWIAAGAAAVAGSYIAAAVGLRAASGRALPLGRTTLVQLAAAAANRVTPAGAGGIAVNARFLLRRGLTPGETAATVALTGAAHAVVAGVAVLGFAAAGTLLPSRLGLAAMLGMPRLTSFLHSHGQALAITGTAVAVVVTAHVAYRAAARANRPATHRTPPSRYRSAVAGAAATLGRLAREPRRGALLLASTAVVKLANLFALQAALWAFDGDTAALRVAAVYLVGVTAAEAIPTPAGLGSVDAVLLGGLTATSSAGAAAVGAVVVFRLLSYWAPILPGLFASAVLRRQLAL